MKCMMLSAAQEERYSDRQSARIKMETCIVACHDCPSTSHQSLVAPVVQPCTLAQFLPFSLTLCLSLESGVSTISKP